VFGLLLALPFSASKRRQVYWYRDEYFPW